MLPLRNASLSHFSFWIKIEKEDLVAFDLASVYCDDHRFKCSDSLTKKDAERCFCLCLLFVCRQNSAFSPTLGVSSPSS